MSDWTTAAERLCRAVAEDLRDTPVYLVDGADVEKFDPAMASPHNSGWTSWVVDLQLSELLIDADRWEGRGFCAVIYPQRCGPLPELLGTVLHELAHWMDFSRCDLRDATPAEAIASGRELRSWLRLPPPDRPPERLPPWHNHGADFVRAAAHLAYRAGRLVESVRPHRVNFASPYYYPPFNEAAFLDALGDELRREGSIRDILATPAPQTFCERWEQATSWFYNANKT